MDVKLTTILLTYPKRKALLKRTSQFCFQHILCIWVGGNFRVGKTQTKEVETGWVRGKEIQRMIIHREAKWKKKKGLLIRALTFSNFTSFQFIANI